MQKEDTCPCKSGKPYAECCGPVIEGARKAETAEALMRARYTAYVNENIDFLRDSFASSSKDEFDYNSVQAWSRAARWHGLEIIRTEAGGAGDDHGVVEFRAIYTANGEFCNHHEVSEFVRENGEWKFVDGNLVGETPFTREQPKVGRNDPCPCGSGKKYKQCCGRNA